MYKKWLKERLKKARTMTAYTIYKAELDRIEGMELLELVKARLRVKIESVGI